MKATWENARDGDTIGKEQAKHTAVPWATDGRFIVQEVEGRSFWSGQPFIADCAISQATRSESNTVENARFICRAVNAHADLLEACKLAMGTIEAFRRGMIPQDLQKHVDTERFLRVALEKAGAR